MEPAVSTSRNQTRERILDAAATVMRDQGLTRATTKAIAAEAGYSEALLYKHFADKHDIYLGVLRERVTGYRDPSELLASATVHANLVASTVQLMGFYVQTFPMSASIFGSPELLVGWREGVLARGGGPDWPLRNLRDYLVAERDAERLDAAVDVDAVAVALCGLAFQQAFLACFHGRDSVDDAEGIADRLVTALGL
jgi:AcrR family transcriptional regulator